MPNFNITTILGYSLKKEYSGTMNYRNVITIDVEALFKTTESSVYDNILPIPADYVNPEVYQNSLTPISLNNNGFGLGRVISISQPSSVNFDENGLQFWKRKITIELYEVGDNSNTPDNAANTFYARLKTNLFDSRIREITEDFNFADDEGGNLGYTHTVSVSCDDTIASGSPNNNTQTGVYLARQKAQSLIESEVNFGYLGNLANLYGKVGKRTFSTDVDVINGTVTITKTFTSFLVKYPASYSFSVESDGSINISESITFKNKDLATRVDLIGGIISILDNVKSSAYARCLGYFNVYKLFIIKGENVDALSASSISLISINRTFNEESQEYTQQMVFSNSRSLRSDYTLEINQTINKDNKGIFTLSENADFVSKSKKINGVNQPFLAPFAIRDYLYSEQTNSLTRAIKLYNLHNKSSISSDPATTPLKLISCSRKASSNGKVFGYSVSFSNDPSFIRDGVINTINSKINATIPKRIVKTYIVPGYLTNKNIFSQQNDQSSSGLLNVNQTVVLRRIEDNKTPDLVKKPIAAINSVYNRCLLTLLNRLTGFGLGDPNNFIINSVTFSYNSSRNLDMTVSIVYFVAANKFGPGTTLYTN
jgi:hypothetical protein